jgi:hypothetical protein
MGCDIHLYVEKKVDGKWEAVSGVNEAKCKYYRDRIKESGKEKDSVKQYLAEALASAEAETYSFLYDGRNYALFSMLADVRNKRDTRLGYVPINSPRGLPVDVSAVIREKSDEYGCDGHSHSYLTARELLEYDWNKNAIVFGVVDEYQYLIYKRNGKPTEYCGDVGGQGVVRCANEEMNAFIFDPSLKDKDKHYYTRVCWQEPYKESAGNFYNWSLPKLKELAGDDPDNTRIVFWFDN